MADGLEWTLELKAQMSELKQAVAALKDVRGGMKDAETGAHGVEKSSERAGHGHRKHSEEAKHLEGALHRLVHSGMEPFLERAKSIAEFEFIRRGVDAILEAPGELIEKVKELAGEILKTAGAAEEANITLKALFGAEEAEQITEYSEKFAKVSALTGKQVREMERALGNAGFKPGEDLERGLRAAADLGALSGRGAAGAQEAASMFERLQNMGEMNPRMLNMFGIKREDFWKELSRQTGVGVATLKKQMDKGKVDIEMTKAAIYTVITKKTGQDLGGLGGDVGKDFNSKLKNLRDLPEMYFEKLADSPAFEHIKDKMQEIFDVLDPNTPRGKKIFDSFEHAVVTVADAVAQIDFEKIAKTLETDVIPALGEIVALVKPLIEFTTTGIHALSSAGDAVAQPITDTILNTQKLFDNLAHPIDSLGDYFRTIGGHTGNGMVDGMKKGKPAVAAAAKDTAGAAVDAAKDRLGVHSPSKAFEHLGRMSVEGYSLGLERGQDAIRAATMSVTTPQVAPSSRGGRGIDVGGISINIAVSSPGGPEAAEEIARKLTEILPEKIRAAVLKGTGSGGQA